MEPEMSKPIEPKTPACQCGQRCEKSRWARYFEEQGSWRELYQKEDKSVDKE